MLQTATQVLPYALQTSILILFGILFCWVSAGFWTALMGFLELLTGHDKYRISGKSAGDEPIPKDARTAIVMPICNEDVPRVFAGLRATYESLAATGDLDRFDFFVLSDSNDADICVAEQQAWLDVCREAGASARSSTAGAGAASSARAATSTTSAVAGAVTTTTWSCSTPTA